MLTVIIILLALGALGNGFMLLRGAVSQQARPRGEAVVLGAVTNFFDTLGIGSFAPSMAWFNLRRLVPDHLIPPTLIAGHTPAAIVQGVVFLVLLGGKVDPVLLIGNIVALTIGGLIGARLIYRTRAWLVQGIVGLALIVAAIFYALSNIGLMPIGGTASSLPPGLTAIAIAASFVFGILLNFGVGNFAPTLAMLSLMGLDPRYCFPIMAGSCSLAGIAVASRHRAGREDRLGDRAGYSDWRHPRRPGRGLLGQIDAGRNTALSGDGSGTLYCGGHAPLCGGGTAQIGLSAIGHRCRCGESGVVMLLPQAGV